MEHSELTILLTCNLCEKSKTATVPEKDWARYVDGVIPSSAFTTLNDQQKSLISSGICEQCWLSSIC